MHRRLPVKAKPRIISTDHKNTLRKDLSPFTVDPFRAIVFPNTIRQWRLHQGMPKLLQLGTMLPHIPYVRLSKIERGEVVAKAEEVIAIANALDRRPEELLINVDEPGFDIKHWAVGLQDWEAIDPEEDRFAVILAAAVRARREQDRSLTIARLERDYGIAPVILSRLENAQKVLGRWNSQTIGALCRLFDVADIAGLRTQILSLYYKGSLDSHLNLIANPVNRIEKSREKIAALRQDIAANRTGGTKTKTAQPPRPLPFTSREEHGATPPPATSPVTSSAAAARADDMAMVRLVPVFGTPLPDGLIARKATGETVEAPRRAGPRSYGLRVCRPTLGPGLPARAVVVVDPDCPPSAGGIVAASEPDGLRLLMVTFDRRGKMVGYSQDPDREVALDALDPTALATVIGAIYE
jgi:transcriptional regulator with XRE-family HTH domain